MALKVHTSRLLIRQAAQALDAGDPNSNTFCAMAKLHATEECYTAIDTGLPLSKAVFLSQGTYAENIGIYSQKIGAYPQMMGAYAQTIGTSFGMVG